MRRITAPVYLPPGDPRARAAYDGDCDPPGGAVGLRQGDTLCHVAEQLPIFPLNTVLFPGVALPLHIFEQRYRDLVDDLVAVPDTARRLLGIVAIREGYEVSGRAEQHRSQSMFRVGTVAQLTAVEAYEDGRFDIEVRGRSRMRVEAVHPSDSYIVADVAMLPADPPADEVRAEAAARALVAYEGYRDAVSAVRGAELLGSRLPRDPELLSYALGASCLLTLRQRQQLLEAPTTTERLVQLRDLLRAELGAMRVVPSLPATELARSGWSPN